MSLQPTVGAWLERGAARFVVWAPEVKSLELVVRRGNGGESVHSMPAAIDGLRSLVLEDVSAGDRYGYRVDGQGPFPDPASRFQPDGVNGLSEVIDASSFAWSDEGHKPPRTEDLIVYELHVGTFSPDGTFDGVTQKLSHLKDLGVTAVELMPVADFPGTRNWGYDGVSLFAPARCYGRPDDLRRLVNEAHRLGLAVLLDVVYNHFGPDGNYTGAFSPYYVSKRHKTPWGDSLNFDDAHSDKVRRFFIDNALHWITEYHFDGLRLDATHAIRDDGERHFLAELTDEVKKAARERPALLIAEDHRNLAHQMKSTSRNGWGLDAVWADDFHHQNRRLLAGDVDGYFRDFTGTTKDLALTIKQGWFYTGQYSRHLEENRGTPVDNLPPACFVICLQNHDQVGNRAFGERLHHQIDPAAYRAASALFLLCPETPMLFMGQEWAASSPFLFFTDHNEQLGPLVTAGRREEFKKFKAFSDPEKREQIPDPQAFETFNQCKLPWSELASSPHEGVHRLYRDLLALRRSHPALRAADREHFEVEAVSATAVMLRRWDDDGNLVLVICQLSGAGQIRIPKAGRDWHPTLSTEDSSYCADPHPPKVDLSTETLKIDAVRPCAILLTAK